MVASPKPRDPSLQTVSVRARLSPHLDRGGLAPRYHRPPTGRRSRMEDCSTDRSPAAGILRDALRKTLDQSRPRRSATPWLPQNPRSAPVPAVLCHDDGIGLRRGDARAINLAPVSRAADHHRIPRPPRLPQCPGFESAGSVAVRRQTAATPPQLSRAADSLRGGRRPLSRTVPPYRSRPRRPPRPRSKEHRHGLSITFWPRALGWAQYQRPPPQMGA